MRENTPQLWDDVWEAAGNVEAPIAVLETEARTIRWRRMGEEYPFSRAELRAICRELGIEGCGFLGESLLASARFLAPTRTRLWWGRLRDRLRLPRVKMVPGTPLDAYLSYALVMYARK